MNSILMAIRGATTIDSDCKEEIIAKTTELFAEIVKRNVIDGEKNRCVSVIIGTTQDIHSYYPARAMRESGILDAPVFSCAEPEIEGALPLCIRVMLTVECSAFIEPSHVYLHKAAALRPDIMNNK